MAPLSVDPKFAKVAFPQDVNDPGWMGARPSPLGPPELSKDVPANLDVGAIAQTLYAIDAGVAPGAAVGSLAEVQRLADAPPASSSYGPVAPAWARRHPRLILAWACLRALRWLLRDFWRAFITYVSQMRFSDRG